MKNFFILLIILIITFIIALTLGIYNNQLISFNYLIAKGEFQLSTLLLIAFGVGVILSWIMCFPLYLRTIVQLKRVQRKLRKLENLISDSDTTVSK